MSDNVADDNFEEEIEKANREICELGAPRTSPYSPRCKRFLTAFASITVLFSSGKIYNYVYSKENDMDNDKNRDLMREDSKELILNENISESKQKHSELIEKRKRDNSPDLLTEEDLTKKQQFLNEMKKKKKENESHDEQNLKKRKTEAYEVPTFSMDLGQVDIETINKRQQEHKEQLAKAAEKDTTNRLEPNSPLIKHFISEFLDAKDVFTMILCSNTSEEKVWKCYLDEKFKKLPEEFTEYLAKQLDEKSEEMSFEPSLPKVLSKFNFVFKISKSVKQTCNLKFKSSLNRQLYEVDYFFSENGLFDMEKDPKEGQLKRQNALCPDGFEKMMEGLNSNKAIPVGSEVQFRFLPKEQKIQILVKSDPNETFSLQQNFFYEEIQFCVTSEGKNEDPICHILDK